MIIYSIKFSSIFRNFEKYEIILNKMDSLIGQERTDVLNDTDETMDYEHKFMKDVAYIFRNALHFLITLAYFKI